MSDIHGVSDNPQNGMKDLFEFMRQGAAKVRRAETAAHVMKRAWSRARRAAEKFGGKASDYIRETMKSSWETEKKFYGHKGTTPKNTDKNGSPISVNDMKLSILYQVFDRCESFADSSDGSGSSMEQENINRIRDYIDELQRDKDKGADWIIDHIEKSGKTVYQLADMIERIILGHYDEVYSRWAGGTEAFKQALREIEEALSGTNDNTLMNKFF